jgi:hypothetical protein
MSKKTRKRFTVETVNRYGLKKRHLHRHWKEVKAFFDETCGGESPSEVARGYQARFEKYYTGK